MVGVSVILLPVGDVVGRLEGACVVTVGDVVGATLVSLFDVVVVRVGDVVGVAVTLFAIGADEGESVVEFIFTIDNCDDL